MNDKVQQRLSIKERTYDELINIKKKESFKKLGDAVDYLFEENIRLTQQLEEQNFDEINKTISTIKKSNNKQDKMLQILIDFVNTHTLSSSDYPVNISTDNETSTWYDSAIQDIEQRIQNQKTYKLSNTNN